MNMSLQDLPLCPTTLQLLKKRGFCSVSELAASCKGSLSNAAQELDCTVPQAAAVWRQVQAAVQTVRNEKSHSSSAARGSENHPNQQQQSNTTTTTTTATALMKHQTESQSNNSGAIITFSKSVDQMLDGGISLGELTELAGCPGTGKTQWGMQLAANARLPAAFGGVQGETVYVDSEGSFSPERCYSISQALVQHIEAGTARRRRQQQQQSTTTDTDNSFTPESILEGIHVYRVHDQAAQTAVLYALPAFLKQRQSQGSPVRLIVIDSMAFHFRAASVDDNDYQYYVQRTRLLTAQAAFLAQLAVDFGVAVVTINQMTTQFAKAADGATTTTRVVPALGESWAHAVTTRLVLSNSSSSSGGGGNTDTRTCQLSKSPRLPSGQATYCITPQGVRGGVAHNKRPRTSGE